MDDATSAPAGVDVASSSWSEVDSWTTCLTIVAAVVVWQIISAACASAEEKWKKMNQPVHVVPRKKDPVLLASVAESKSPFEMLDNHVVKEILSAHLDSPTAQAKAARVCGRWLTHSLPPKGRVFTLQDIKPYHGRDNMHILVAVKYDVFDMTIGDDFYGPEGPYKCFSGGNASVALARMSLEQADVDIGDTWDKAGVLSDEDLGILGDWYTQYEGKYRRLGMFARNEKEAVNCLRTVQAGFYRQQGELVPKDRFKESGSREEGAAGEESMEGKLLQPLTTDQQPDEREPAEEFDMMRL